jgi:DNA repair protein RecO
MGTLTEYAERTSHSGLRRRLDALHAGLFMVELAGATLAEGDPHPEVFDLFSGALRRLDAPDAPAPAVLAWFQWRLLQLAGLLGELTHCVQCGAACVDPAGRTRAGVWFTSRLGGLLCRSCEAAHAEKYALAPPAARALDAMRAVQQGRRAPLSDDQADALNRLLAYHVTDTLGRPLKMLRHVRRK